MVHASAGALDPLARVLGIAAAVVGAVLRWSAVRRTLAVPVRVVEGIDELAVALVPVTAVRPRHAGIRMIPILGEAVVELLSNTVLEGA